MQQLKKLKILFFLFVMFFVSACDDDVVGKWDPMQWEYKNVSEGIKIVKGNDKDKDQNWTKIEVSKSGSLDIVCKNYKGFWFEDYPEMKDEETSRNLFSSENCIMKIEGHTMHCEFINIETCPSEEFKIVVTAGDVFFQFNVDIK